MKRRIVFLVLMAAGSISPIFAQQQQPTAISERNPPVISKGQFFQNRLEKLYKAINDKQNDRIASYERDLLASMREAIEDGKTGSDKKTYTQRMNEILNSFENFTFVGASKDSADAHLALLEEFLAMVISE